MIQMILLLLRLSHFFSIFILLDMADCLFSHTSIFAHSWSCENYNQLYYSSCSPISSTIQCRMTQDVDKMWEGSIKRWVLSLTEERQARQRGPASREARLQTVESLTGVSPRGQCSQSLSTTDDQTDRRHKPALDNPVEALAVLRMSDWATHSGTHCHTVQADPWSRRLILQMKRAFCTVPPTGGDVCRETDQRQAGCYQGSYK